MRCVDELAVQKIAGQLEQYFAANAGAADSLEGICGWWLPSELRNVDRDTVKRALDVLVAQGKVDEVSLVDGTTIYRHR